MTNVTMKGKTDTNSYTNPFKQVNHLLSIRMPKKIRSKHSTNRLTRCLKNISICLKYCDICSNVQMIYSPVQMVRQTIQMLQGPFVNRLSSMHFSMKQFSVRVRSAFQAHKCSRKRVTTREEN